MTESLESPNLWKLSPDKVREIADTFGTPIYVFDETSFRNRIRHFKKSFENSAAKFGFESHLVFAAKANPCVTIMKIASEEGCYLDVASEGEFRSALLAGASPESCQLHGNNKSSSELDYCLSQGVGMVIIDNFEEIDKIARSSISPVMRFALRLAPSVDPITHEKISVGQADTKFGFNITNGNAEEAVKMCLEAKIPLVGFHNHVGSQLLDPEAQRLGGETIAKFALKIFQEQGYRAEYLNLGGGLGIAYTPNQIPTLIPEYCDLIVEAVRNVLSGSPIEPVLVMEPGRALVAESGVSIYSVGVKKLVPLSDGSIKTYLAVDGGLSDNPRPALYSAVYSVELVPNPDRKVSDELQQFTISGKHCETDTLFPNIFLSQDAKVGDYLQILATGAYNSSMASNYNLFLRPATIMITEDNQLKLIQKRETWAQLFSREVY